MREARRVRGMSSAHQPVRVFAQKESYRSDASGPHTAILLHGGMGRYSRPHDFAGKTELIEKLGIIVRDSTRQDFGFPGSRRDFVSLQLADDLQGSISAMQLASARDVLPGLQEAFEIEGRYRFDFAPQPPKGGAMNASQNAAVAPLYFCVALAF